MSTLVVTGAGVSLESGIPTFRGSDPGAVWTNDTTSKGTLAYFHRNPVASWQWYLGRFLKYSDAKPNAAHFAIAEWEKKRPGQFLLVSQNVDSLHEQAGSENLVKIHGSAKLVRCARMGCRYGAPGGTLPFLNPQTPSPIVEEGVDFREFLAKPRFETLPRCKLCHALIRPHVLWFDEYYADHRLYQWDRVMEFVATQATEVWFIGTSMAVTVTTEILSRAQARNLRVRAINPSEDFAGAYGEDHIRAHAEVWLPEFVASL